MKKLILSFIGLLLILQSFGQLNPIQNLQWVHWYEYPENCFNLSWDEPDSSFTDTLMGYNIYRDTTLYNFTTNGYFSCNPCMGQPPNSFCDFISFNNGQQGFTICVKAVYNNTHSVEAECSETEHCGGVAIGINEINEDNSKIFPNPTTGKITIEAEGIVGIEIIDITGKIITNTVIASKAKQSAIKNEIATGYHPRNDEIDLSTQPKGIYFIKVTTQKGVVVEKLIKN